MLIDTDKFVMLDGFIDVPGGCPMFYPDCPLKPDFKHIHSKDCCIIIGFLHGENMKQCPHLTINEEIKGENGQAQFNCIYIL